MAPRVCVVGAGLSGLTCTLDLARGGAEVTVPEAGRAVAEEILG